MDGIPLLFLFTSQLSDWAPLVSSLLIYIALGSQSVFIEGHSNVIVCMFICSENVSWVHMLSGLQDTDTKTQPIPVGIVCLRKQS